MGWGVHDYPEPPRERAPARCPCGEELTGDAYMILGEWQCPKCAAEYIRTNYSLLEIAEAVGIDRTEGCYL